MTSETRPATPDPVGFVRRHAPGLLVAGVVALCGWLIARATGWPGIVVALLIGMALNPLALRPALKPGYTLAVKKLLRVAIALLGVRIALGDIAALGLGTAALVMGSMAVTLLAGIAAARLFGASSAYGALAGGATAVCGASAALAIASVLPKDDRRDTDAAFVVLAVNALSTVAMILYPLLGHALGYSDHVNGIMLGATIHDVAQVVGAGYGISAEAGDTATIVKLFRVFLLLPVVLIIGLAFAGADAGRAKAPVPVFAIMFVVFATVNSLGLIPEALRTVLLGLSQAGLFLAIAAPGLQTSLVAMLKLGWRPMAIVLAATLVLLAVVVGLSGLGMV